MDIQKIINDAVSKLTGNTDLITKFLGDPSKVLKDLLGIDIPADKLTEIVNGIKGKLDLSGIAGAAVEKTGILGKLKGLFSK